jgi:large repetitive protein
VASIGALSVPDTANAVDWSVQGNLQNGAQQFGDRAFTISALPSALAGGAWVRSANDSKAYAGNPLVSFSLSQPADVFITLDDRANPQPAWLAGWSITGLKMSSNEGGTARSLTVYTKSFPAGTVSLGPLNQGVSMYNVIVK